MHIISASRTTDIPAFYADWFMQRIRAGFCHWLHPYSGKIYRLSLDPDNCLAIVFWTRHPAPLLPALDELDDRGFKYFFQVTMLGYPAPLETHAPKLDQAIDAFRALAERLSPDRVFWRYDPILLSPLTPAQYHIDRFGQIARKLSGLTHRCTYAWPMPLEHVDARLSRSGITLDSPSTPERYALLEQLAQIANANGIDLYSCFNDDHANVPAIRAGSCVDLQVIRQVTAQPNLDVVSATQLSQALRSMHDRPSALQALAGALTQGLKTRINPGPCRCAASIDIGGPETCLFGCAYCLATHSGRTALQNYWAHDSADTLFFRPEHLRGVDLETLETQEFQTADDARVRM
jgi:hypothetical protein